MSDTVFRKLGVFSSRLQDLVYRCFEKKGGADRKEVDNVKEKREYHNSYISRIKRYSS